jgi:pyruvate/2-oxoglutarate dehydrogenase complex dihydrolipoamide dehydrogenase (E3) component
MSVDAVGIVGAGNCGLIAGRLLAERVRRVVVVERLPAAGGQEPERPGAELLARMAADAGLELVLGTTAVRWEGNRLETLGIGGADRIDLDALVVATGSRPATRAELGIAGDRCAGVLPGSAALHMIEAGMLPGRNPVVVGGGSLAGSLVRALQHAGAAEVTVVAPDGVLDETVRGCNRLFEGWDVETAIGMPRLQHVAVTRVGDAGNGSDPQGHRVFADALLLAHRRIPMRNVEGAIGPGPGVHFCQSEGDPKTVLEAEERAEQAVFALQSGVWPGDKEA